MPRPDYPIRTDRLLLRPFEERDLDDLFAYRTRPDVQRYLFTEVPHRAACQEVLAKRITEDELTEEGQRLALALYSPEARRVVGDVVLKWLSETDRQGEIGYSINPEFQGRGLATEAAGAMLELGFEWLGLHRIIARCDPRNEPSWRLMERLGMRREAHFRDFGIMRGEWGDLVVYAMLAEEYRGAAS